MSKVFISYSNKDSILKDKIGNMLRQCAFKTYVDVEDVRPAQYLPRKIKDAIDKSDVLVAIITENSLQSSWVQNEIGYADGRMPIVPLVVGEVRPGGILTGREFVIWNATDVIDFKTIIGNALTDFSPSKTPAVCDPGPWKIESGLYAIIELDASKGDRVRGRIEETGGGDFDWYIVDEKNLVSFQNADDYNYEGGGEGLTSYTVAWTARGKGPWYLVLEVPRRRNARHVSVFLRKE